MIYDKIIIDLHTHSPTTRKIAFFNLNYQIFLKKLLAHTWKKYKIASSLICDFDEDVRYEKILSSAKRLSPDYITDFKYEELFFSIQKENKIFYFIYGQEIPTKEGHIIIIGHEKKIKSRKIDDLFNEVNPKKCIIIAPHPLHHTRLSKLFDQERLSLDANIIKKYKRNISALELSPYFPKDWRKIIDLSKELKIPLVANSDAHFINEFFHSPSEHTYISFENPSKLIDSIKDSIKNKPKIFPKAHTFEKSYKHVLQEVLKIAGRITKILKE